MMGHATSRMQDRYSHVIADAHLSPLLSMADAIAQARESVDRAGMHPRCTDAAPVVLRRSL